jgi:hypothetical protein
MKSFAPDKFFFDDSFSTLTFNRDAAGNVTEAILDDRGALQTYKKTNKPLPAHVEIKLEPETLNRYMGDYELLPGFILTVTVEGDRIFTQATGQSKVEIYPESETKFFLKIIDASLDFVADESGKYNKVVLHQGGKDLEGKR